jgi:hypothetical protein
MTRERIPQAPPGSGTAGKRLWRSVVQDYELAEHESALLREAVRVADVCAELQTIVDEEGLLLAGKAHPALVELRAERVLLARLLVALRVPLGDAEERPSKHGAPRLQRRGARGFYGVRGVVA